MRPIKSVDVSPGSGALGRGRWEWSVISRVALTSSAPHWSPSNGRLAMNTHRSARALPIGCLQQPLILAVAQSMSLTSLQLKFTPDLESPITPTPASVLTLKSPASQSTAS